MRNGHRDRKSKSRTQGAGPPPAEGNEKPRNTDRAAWGGLAMATLAAATGLAVDLRSDPETVLGDLLADLMHWCDACEASGHPARPVDFESALKRARAHYRDEAADERRRSLRGILR